MIRVIKISSGAKWCSVSPNEVKVAEHFEATHLRDLPPLLLHEAAHASRDYQFTVNSRSF
jgi:hypothetical protein